MKAPPPAPPITDVTVIVQTVPNRGVAWDQSRASIEASDIGTHYECREHPPGTRMMEFFLSVMEECARAPTPWVLRLEDDAICNRFILHNLMTWNAIHDPRFGAGWAFAPGGQIGWYVHSPRLHGSLGVLFRTSMVPSILTAMRRVYARLCDDHGQDMVISGAVWELGKHVVIHSPSLIEHPIGQSVLKHETHPVHDTSNGRFDIDYRR
jgi:hypothetical protein